MLSICNTKHNKIVTHTATFAKGNIRYGWAPPYYFFDDKKYQKNPLVNTLFQHRIKIIDLIFLTSRFYQTHFKPHVYRMIRTRIFFQQQKIYSGRFSRSKLKLNRTSEEKNIKGKKNA